MKKLTFIFIAALLFIPVGRATQAQTEWTKYAGNPVLVEGSAGSWDENYLVEASVLFDGTNFGDLSKFNTHTQLIRKLH